MEAPIASSTGSRSNARYTHPVSFSACVRRFGIDAASKGIGELAHVVGKEPKKGSDFMEEGPSHDGVTLLSLGASAFPELHAAHPTMPSLIPTRTGVI